MKRKCNYKGKAAGRKMILLNWYADIKEKYIVMNPNVYFLRDKCNSKESQWKEKRLFSQTNSRKKQVIHKAKLLTKHNIPPSREGHKIRSITTNFNKINFDKFICQKPFSEIFLSSYP